MYSHVVVNATRAANDLATGLEQLERDLEVETNNLMPSRLWAILFHGLELRFYEYHRDLPAGHRLIPMSPPSEPGQHTLKMRDDEEEIQGMMTYLVLNEPTAI
ncbi:uncharacterized protein N7483_010800 [Penicillium malachiteum]|uniref:uncharacterized protein n=1 Tax=Penicillium malachiteum TaxID=1324776 RepID=UPI0025473C7F|nr:uncharacterized protein N7483_010800 [Penicillium malachiteum]KAJ5713619.1 hypothetical protein N7483_010800 [Penicillium malachiteum]